MAAKAAREGREEGRKEGRKKGEKLFANLLARRGRGWRKFRSSKFWHPPREDFVLKKEEDQGSSRKVIDRANERERAIAVKIPI